MIIWLASYPKSGNTWLRSLIASYFYQKDGDFNFDLLNFIDQFPSVNYFKKYEDSFLQPESTAEYWIKEQENINRDKKLRFFKTHNALCKINNFSFTDSKNTIAAIHIVRDPRNVVTSLSNHYQINKNEAFDFMKNEKKALIEKKNNKFLGFVPLFSWKFHQESWSECKKFPVLTIRYEDLQADTFKTFKSILNFFSGSKQEKSNLKPILNIKNLHGTGSIDTWLRVVFRLSCAYLAIHTALFWMVLNPVPGIMVVLFRESLEVREYPSEGFEKLGTFSSWTLILFGASMLLNGLISIGVGVGAEIPSWLVMSGVSIFATGFGSAALTALVVRHVIIPSMVENGENLDHMFKPHEHVMHNLALILLSIDLLLGGMVVLWTLISLSLIVGALYLIFAEFWAIRGGGYYVYEFIDPRPRFAPQFDQIM